VEDVRADVTLDLYERYEDVLLGIGELGFAKDSMRDRSFTDPPWPRLFE
jgi:hypothetical protein